ncbi:phytoene/squalene synthase family protein [Corynebacterium camporealensis]
MHTSKTPEAEFLRRYDAMADKAAAQVVKNYSTSFGLSTAILSPPLRRDIRNLYAVVRIADEIVDGTAAEGLGVAPDSADAAAALHKLLDEYEAAVRTASKSRFHTDPILHAFGRTARRCEFNDEHLAAFFHSMRQDLHRSAHSAESLETYIYGSAEVIGLLCLAAFFGPQRRELSEQKWAELEHGARSLGSAFQKVNFLRDLSEDYGELGRTYFSGSASELQEADKDRIVAEIDAELAAARATFGDLPLSARTGVMAAASLFEELNRMIEQSSVDRLLRERISVPARRKSVLIARAIAQAPRMSARKDNF